MTLCDVTLHDITLMLHHT